MRRLQFMKPPRLHRGFDWNEAAVNFSMPRPVAFDVPTRLVTAANRAFKRDGERGVRGLLNGPSGPVLRARGEAFVMDLPADFRPGSWALRPLGGMLYSQVLHEPPPLPKLRPFKSMADYQAVLLRHGFEKLGSGHYGSAWAKPGQPWVLKMGNHKSDGWPAYAALVMDKHATNPFAPRIKSLRWHGDFYVAVVERLTSTLHAVRHYSDAATKATTATYERATRALYLLSSAGGWSGRPILKGVASLKCLQRETPELYRLVQDIRHELVPESNIDFHDENAMVDGSRKRLVITDPISSTTLDTRKSTRRVTSRAIAA